MDDDIVERLRARESHTNCWQCGEYGCLPADCNYWTRKPAPCVCAEHRRPPSPDGFVCACNCHEPSPLMLEAADEIERLRVAGDVLVAAIRNHDLREKDIKGWEEASRG